jgi:hypothetical protein
LSKVASLDEDRILRQFVSTVMATLRTNLWQTTGPRAAPNLTSASSSIRARFLECRSPSRCSKSGYIRPALKACTCAWWQGCAGWAALVGPPGRLPHRNSGSGQGPAGQEHRHCAGGLQGWFCAEECCHPPRPRGLYGRGHCLLQAVPLGLLDITDNVVKGGWCHPTWCATMWTTPTWWWPPTRARPPSRTLPMGCQPTTASGWVMRLRPVARSVTTTRRWASLRAAPGRPSSALPLAGCQHPDDALHRGRHWRHVGRRVWQRHAAVRADQAGRGL